MKRVMFHIFPLLLATAIFAQTSPTTSEKPKLQLGVVVTDKNNLPIPDLTGNDFTIEVRGTAVSDIKAAENAKTSTQGQGLIVIVLDTMHTRWIEERDLRPVITTYLKSLAGRNAPVQLVLLTREGALVTVHDYRTNSETLTAALDRADAIVHKRSPGGNSSAQIIAETDRLVDFLKGTVANYTNANVPLRVSPNAIFETFQRVSQMAGGIPGRKSLVWVTGLMPFEVEEKSGRLVSSSGTANANASGGFGKLMDNENSMSDSEVRDLQVLWRTCMADLLKAEIAVDPVAARGSNETGVDIETLHAMRAVAALTGGREVHPVGDPFKLLTDLPEQNLAAYDLAAVAPDAKCPNDWCGIKITVKRPDAHVIAPSGIFRNVNTAGPAVVVGTTATSDANGIPFTVQWTKSETSSGKKKMGFNVTFPPEASVPPAGITRLDLEIHVTAATATGANKQSIKFTAQNDLGQQQLDQIHQKGFALSNAIDLLPGEYVVKFTVQDKVGGRTGTITVPLTVS